MTPIKPATQLPWTYERFGVIRGGASVRYINGAAIPQIASTIGAENEQNAAYIVHACNEFQRLVDENQRLREALRSTLELIYSAGNLAESKTYSDASALLAELGEAT